MRRLVIGQRPKAPNFSAFHWSPHGCLITIGQHFVTTRVVPLPKRNETSLITESDQSRANHQLLQLCTVRTAWSDSDQAVRAVHSCISWNRTRLCGHLLQLCTVRTAWSDSDQAVRAVHSCISWNRTRLCGHLLQLCTVRTAWSDSDQAVRAVHSCISWNRTRLCGPCIAAIAGY